MRRNDGFFPEPAEPGPMVRTAIQLHSLRSLEESVPQLVHRVAETAFDGVELAGLGASSAAEVAEALEETGMAVAGAHVGLESLEAAFDETRTTYASIGCPTLVVPHLDAAHFEDVVTIRAAADRMNDVARRLDRWGIDLCYHNHDHEFVPVGSGHAFDAWVEQLDGDIGIELDVGWAAAAGADPVDMLDRLDGRVPLVHLKDVDAAGSPVELGTGILDLEACVEAACHARVDWLVYEHDEPDDPARSLDHGAKTLAALREEYCETSR